MLLIFIQYPLSLLFGGSVDQSDGSESFCFGSCFVLQSWAATEIELPKRILDQLEEGYVKD